MSSSVKIIFFFVLINLLGSTLVTAQIYPDNSVLSEGDWFKIGVVNSGVYKLDYNFLKKLGVLKKGINPQNIKIYGNGGAMLPQPNSAPRPLDLLENSIVVAGEEDGTFDKNDYVLFFGSGTETANYDTQQKRITVAPNIYSDTSYYFVTVGNSAGKRVEQVPLTEGGQEIATYDAFFHHELENVNILSTEILLATKSGSGREWYGEEFNFTTTKSFNLNLDGLVPDSELSLHSSVLGCSSSESSFSVSIGNEVLGSHVFRSLTPGVYNAKGDKSEDIFSSSSTSFSNTSDVSLQYSYDKKSNSEAIGFLNFFTLNYKRALRIYNDQISFTAFESLNKPISRYKISSLSPESRIWDITNFTQPKEIQFQKNR